MKISTWLMASTAALALAAASGAAAADLPTAKAKLMDPTGKDVGEVTFTEAPNGVLLHARLQGMPPGTHAFHLHQTGVCEPPFQSAGGHLNPTGKQHGLLSPAGHHLGDMPNIHVPDSGALEVEVFIEELRFEHPTHGMFDADGAAVVIHEGPDDYTTDPAGAAGPRIACGVIERGA